MARTLLLSIPALTRDLLAHVPPASRLGALRSSHRVHDLTPTWPAVTCSVQASLTTGTVPSEHGIIANGIPTYRNGADADLTDPANHVWHRRRVSFWEQSNRFLGRPRAWQRHAGRKTALLFFQHCMPGFMQPHSPAADIVLTPKPDHGPDGKLTSLLWSQPAGLANELQAQLGPFPLLNYWGPMASIKSSQWIAQSAAAVWTKHLPDLQLTYIPHLDYDLQRFGPRSPRAYQAVADLAVALDPLLEAARDANVILLSEYAISEVHRAIAPNRLLREAGLLTLGRDETGEPCIDYASTPAWVMCDHQIGHVYLHPEADRAAVERVLTGAGVEVLSPSPIRHPRGGDLQVQAPEGAWLDYRWWASTETPPRWALTVDIHSKPGYDPLELFFNPATRTIQTDANLIKGSHGRLPATESAIALLPASTTLSEKLLVTDLAQLL